MASALESVSPSVRNLPQHEVRLACNASDPALTAELSMRGDQCTRWMPFCSDVLAAKWCRALGSVHRPTERSVNAAERDSPARVSSGAAKRANLVAVVASYRGQKPFSQSALLERVRQLMHH